MGRVRRRIEEERYGSRLQVMSHEQTDEELMLRVAAGDADAFARLYERHKEGLLNFCYRMLRNWEDAGDIFQDAFRYLHVHAKTYEPSAKFTTYLFHVARNMCIDVLRRRKRWNLHQLDTEIDIADDAPAPTLPLDQGDLERKIKQAMEELPEPYREVVHLRVIEDLAYEDIAQILECPVGTVKSRLHSGLGLLRQILKRKKIVE
jgi:RNA polymerase sigma-70 factor (ECF subfamily)